jgi:trehalose-6-phosphatase
VDDGNDFDNFLGDLSQAINMDKDSETGDYQVSSEDYQEPPEDSDFSDSLGDDFVDEDDFTDVDL